MQDFFPTAECDSPDAITFTTVAVRNWITSILDFCGDLLPYVMAALDFRLSVKKQGVLVVISAHPVVPIRGDGLMETWLCCCVPAAPRLHAGLYL